MTKRKRFFITSAIIVIVALIVVYQAISTDDLPEGISQGNGRLEATEVDVATKFPGRVESIVAREGDFIKKGDLLAQMELSSLQAQLYEAKAQHHRTIANKESMKAQLATRESEREAAKAMVEEQAAALEIAQSNLSRLKGADQAVSAQRIEEQASVVKREASALKAAEAKLVSATSAINGAKELVKAADAEIAAAQATVARVEVDIKDSELTAPVDGRIQYRIAQVGEVLPSGGKVVNLVDLSDVYMTFFLPAKDAGRLIAGAKGGSEARIVLDAAPEFVIPATVTFVSSVSQFTPKTVETHDERTKLMFRIKAAIDPDLLIKYKQYIKTGVTGNVYVKTSQEANWPEKLAIVLPDMGDLSEKEQEYIGEIEK